jgi:YARHG domain
MRQSQYRLSSSSKLKLSGKNGSKVMKQKFYLLCLALFFVLAWFPVKSRAQAAPIGDYVIPGKEQSLDKLLSGQKNNWQSGIKLQPGPTEPDDAQPIQMDDPMPDLGMAQPIEPNDVVPEPGVAQPQPSGDVVPEHDVAQPVQPEYVTPEPRVVAPQPRRVPPPENEYEEPAPRAVNRMPRRGSSCDDLWVQRNQIFARKGYCFKSSRARAAFGRGCFSPYGRLSWKEKRRVASIKRRERNMGCSATNRQAAPPPARNRRPRARGRSCNDLWYTRNAIFARKGYCFKSKRGRRAFGRSCRPPYGKLNRSERARVSAIKRQERRRGCR